MEPLTNGTTGKMIQITTSQPGDPFRLMTPAQQQVLFENTARAMGDIPEEIKLRHIRNCMKADENYGKGVAKALNIPLEKI